MLFRSVSQSRYNTTTTKPQSSTSQKASKATTTTSKTTSPTTKKSSTAAATTTTTTDIKFEFLTSDEFQDAMKPFLSYFQSDLNIPLTTFTTAVEKHYPSEPLGSVANFIRVNRTIFQQLFQHQIVKSIPSLSGNTTERNEIVQIIFDEYQDIPTLISKLRDKKYSDKEIGPLLRKIYPKHFHTEVDAVLLPPTPEPIKYEQCSDIKVDGYNIHFYRENTQRTKYLDSNKSYLETLLGNVAKTCNDMTYFQETRT